MEEKINISEILKDKPVNTKLYSLIFGDVYLSFIGADIVTVKHHGTSADYRLNAKLYDYDEAEPSLFPSKEMRNWSKFAWKKGDVLAGAFGALCIFDRWANDNYTSFYAKTINLVEDGFLDTNLHTLASEKDAKSFIKCIEEKLGGKLNRETLKIEKAQPEFKDADIAFADYGNRQDVFIVSDKTDLSEGYNSFISLDLSNLTLIMGYRRSFFKKDLCKLRLATEEEKQQLFDALAKEGKRWDAEKKQIVDLPKKSEFKPMDWCLMRYVCEEKDETWSLCQFAYQFKSGQYEAVGGLRFDECIPYNEETAHLLGTTDDWEGGEV